MLAKDAWENSGKIYGYPLAGKALHSRPTAELTVQALLPEIWRRKPASGLLIHSPSRDIFFGNTLSGNGCGNCHEFKDDLKSQNAVAESFFQLLKREKIRRQTYCTREDTRHDVFEYIELFYNPKRKHTNNGMLSSPLGRFVPQIA